ncbi:MAG: hypothetical protein CXR30_00795 [Geobacter sp.]|nr:MAG: hypothetical protein CXR30_00795 [Geobacter sp.]
MRKRSVRNGMRFILAALLMIILASFYHAGIADLLGLSIRSEERLYSLGIFWAAAIGGYGAVMSVFGFILPGNARDTGVRLLPLFLLIMTAVMFFFFLLATSLNEPPRPERLSPGQTITI